jgi:hypothetical protein
LSLPTVHAAPPSARDAGASSRSRRRADAGAPVAAERARGDAGRAGAAREAPPRETAGEQKLNALLSEASRNPAISRAPDPVLKHHGDGSYSFVGNGIKATIDADGTVHFHDRYLAGFQFDLNAWFEHLAGNDPFRSERRWFLERTQPLRDQLAQARRLAAAGVSGAALERALLALWADPKLSCQGRKQETERFWEAAPLSKNPAQQRADIERFVREHTASHRTCPLSVAELRAFDARPSAPAPAADGGT